MLARHIINSFRIIKSKAIIYIIAHMVKKVKYLGFEEWFLVVV